MTSPTPSLLLWATRAIGPRVSRFLLAQLLLVTLIGGVNWRLVAQFIDALHADADLRAGTLALVVIATASSRRSLRHALCPPSLAVLRRQPLGTPSFALFVLPWAVLLAWPWAVVFGVGHSADPLTVLTGWLLGALAICGVVAAASWRALVCWTLVPLAAALVVDRSGAFALPTSIVAATLGTRTVGRGVRAALAPEPWMARRGGTRAALADTPLGALLALDAGVLRTRLHWLSGAWLPLVATLYVIVLDANGNCRGACRDGAALLATTLGAGVSVAVLDALRRVHGARLLVPDRVVPTRRRLTSLFLVTLAPLAPFALVLAVLSREAAVLPHVCAVALAVVWLQLRDTTRAAELGPLAWLLLALVSIVLLPGAFRFMASSVAVLVLAALVDRRGRALRTALATARGPSARY